MRKNTNIEFLIDSIFPDHVLANYPKLVEFAKAFFKYLDQEHKSSYYQNTLYLQRDVREQDPEFAEYIKRELGILSRRNYAVDPNIFYNNIAKIWASKGSEESIKTFFRMFLDDEVSVYYPWESVLIPSDGRWIIETVIRVSKLVGDPEDFAGKKIFQVNSDASAVVSKVERKIYADGIIYELHLIRSTIVGTFLERNTVYVDENTTAEVYRTVTGLAITSKGSGYKKGDKITIFGYEGITFIAYVETVDSSGGILSVRLTDFGSGNTPASVIATNTTKQYYMIDFIYYEYPDPSDIYGLITETGQQPFVNYGLITEAATLASDYGVLFPTLSFTIESESGSGAEFEIVYGALATYQGYYEGVKGQLSESIVLQDSKFYQKYSYEVRTAYTTERWIEPLKKFAHPAGMEVVGNVYSFAKYNTGIKDYFVFVREFDEPSYTLLESPGIETSVTGFTQSYFENSGVYFADDYFADDTFAEVSSIAGSGTVETADLVSTSQDLIS